jgi:hypothetical protein
MESSVAAEPSEGGGNGRGGRGRGELWRVLATRCLGKSKCRRCWCSRGPILQGLPKSSTRLRSRDTAGDISLYGEAGSPLAGSSEARPTRQQEPEGDAASAMTDRPLPGLPALVTTSDESRSGIDTPHVTILQRQRCLSHRSHEAPRNRQVSEQCRRGRSARLCLAQLRGSRRTEQGVLKGKGSDSGRGSGRGREWEEGGSWLRDGYEDDRDVDCLCDFGDPPDHPKTSPKKR